MPNETIAPVKETINEQQSETPRTERNPRGAGRKPHGAVEAGVQQVLDTTASEASAILRKHIKRQRGYKKLPADLQRACEYVIDHAIGKARQKIEHSGGILTYGSLAKEAEKIAAKPRDVLADAEEIAGKRQRLAELADPETAQIKAGLERMLDKVDELPEDSPGPPPDSGTAEAVKDEQS